ncbi:KICSTOR complex protein C12orf66 homolog [Trichonephila clavata]|uniref:KICSTOR complex protein C12orf66 homolog n=1 Tax=Trichonephila clavata TaxID=2740835 RepID=A0A8X6G7T4_TRICU|nr:KICSTOR complex protein C12orf66 homolog [Trichonephila clavata]
MRTAKHEGLEAALLAWFKQARSENALISGPEMLERSNELAKQMGITFSANPGWLERFKKRNGIVFKNVCGAASLILPTMTADWFHSGLPLILEKYEAKDIFNAAKTGLFYCCLPNDTLSFKEQSCSGGELSKERITVFVGCNSNGSEKLPLFVIGKSLKSQCFKNVMTLPVEYTANEEARMIATVFTNWIVKLDERFLREKRKVAMIIDICPDPPNIALKAINLIFLPLYTSVLQPCDQGIIQNMKFFYRKQLLGKYLLAIEANEDFSIHLLDALHILHFAWNSVTPRTIEYCFHHAGFSKVSDSVHKMTDHAELVISKQQIILDNFFSLLGSFAFDKAKEYLDKERDVAAKNHTIAPFFSSALSALSTLATAEKNYANFVHFGSKGFLRKDSSLKSTYEALANEFQRLEEKHYITPVSTPTLSPTSSCRTPSPPSNLPSPVSACSEVSGSAASSLSNASSVRGSTYNYYGEDVLENLASHLSGQLLCYVRARMKALELYEKLYSMSSNKYMKFDLLLNIVTDIVKTNAKYFHHPLLSPLKSSFSFECESLAKLLEAEVHMQNWRFLPSLLCLHDAHSKLGAWVSVPKELKKSTANAYRAPPTTPLYNWLRTLKGELVSKFSLYFHEILSKQTIPVDMKSYCTKTSYDYFSKITSFQKRYDVACVAIVLDTNGLEDYAGHGYSYPEKVNEAPKGLDSFPPIVSYPPNCFSQEKYLLHWPSVVMIMNNKEQEIRNTDTSVSIFDSRMNATYFMAKIEARMTLVVIFETRKTERDSYIYRFMQSVCTQLRGNKLFSSLRSGSK